MQRNRARSFAAIATGAALAVTIGIPAYADNGTDTTALREAVTAAGMTEHLEALQAIADANNGNRAAGTSGHVASAEYVEAQLRAAGYDPVRQPFSYDQYVENSASLAQVSPNPTVYVDQTDFAAMDVLGFR